MEPSSNPYATPLDINRLRSLTPGCAEVVHLNHAGSSLPTAETLRVQVEYLEREARIGGYEAANEAADRVSSVYSSLAALVGAGAEEIGVVENATAAWKQAFSAMTEGVGPTDRILTARAEYGANIVAYQQLSRRTGVSIEIIDDDASGATSPEALAAMIDERVRLVSISHLPTNGGLINPAAEIGSICRAHDVRYLLDACQSAGQMPLDVAQLGCDALTATGRKYLRGPRGTGFIYMSQALLDTGVEPAVLDHHGADLVSPTEYRVRSDARRFEIWETNVAAVLGLGAAVDQALDIGLPAIEAQVQATAGRCRAALGAINGVELRDLGNVQSGICTFTVDGVDADSVRAACAAHNGPRGRINVSTSAPISTIYDSTHRNLPAMVRASVHYLTTDDEIADLCEVVGGLVGSRS